MQRLSLGLLAGLFLFSCSPSTANDCSKTCSGCCNAEGLCQSGVTTDACGQGGFLCSTCAPTDRCTLGVCAPQNNLGGGSGATGGGSGGGAGTTGGGSGVTGGGTGTTGGGGGVTGGGTGTTGGGMGTTGGGSGASGCAGTLRECGTACVDTLADPANCGSCGRACGQGQVCNSGACQVLPDDCTTGAGCGAGYFCDPVSKRCAPGCRLPGDCPIGATCSAGVCGCPAGQHACGQLCVSNSAITSCGTSCSACPSTANGTTTCDGSSCGVACASGYQRSGNACVDVNECATGNGGCSTNATCTNTPGSRTCACRAGFTGDGVTCTDVNECATGNGGCSANATCTNTPGSRTCACSTGFTGDGVTCTDVNECATGNGGCAANATCTNTPGSRTCACPGGYTGTGVTCTDVNECATNNGGCSPDATCTNTPGSRTCACRPGFVGDGLTCTGNGDTCASAITLSLGVTVNGSLVGAANDYGATLPGGLCGNLAVTGPDVVYRFTPPSTGNYRLSLTGSSWYPAVWLSTSCGVASSCTVALEGYQGGAFNFHGTANVPVFIHVDATRTAVSTYTLSVAAVAAPVNDLCSGATPLTAGVTTSGTLVGAATDVLACGGNVNVAEVVHTFTPGTSGKYQFTVPSSVYVALDESCGAGLCTSVSGTSGSYVATLTAGTTYSVYLRSYSGAAYTVLVEPIVTPSNDTCAAPIDLALGATVNGSLLTANDDYGATLPGGQCGSLMMTGPDVVYRFTPPSTGNYQLALNGSSWYPGVWLSTSCGVASSCTIAVDSYQGSTFNFHGTANVPVFIHVDATRTTVSTFTLKVSAVTAPVNDLCSGATALTAGVTTSGTLVGAVTDLLVCGGSVNVADVVHTFTPSTSGKYQFTVPSSVYVALDESCGAGLCTAVTGTSGSYVATLTAGTTYSVYLRSYSSVAYTVLVQAIAAPSNDTCSAPIDLTLGATVNGSLLTANDDYGATLPGGLCGNLAVTGPDVVYRFTPPSTGNYRLTLSGSSWYPAVWLSTSCGVASSCTVALEGYQGGAFNFHGTANVPVFIHVDATRTTVATFSLSVASVAAPVNDLCSGATPLTAGVTTSGTLVGAVTDVLACGGNVNVAEVVHTFRPTTSGTYIFTVPSAVYVALDSSCGGGACLNVTGTSGTYSASLTANTTYTVYLRSYSSIAYTILVQ